MKLRNKKTGEIVDTGRGYLSVPSSSYRTYHSLAELNEEWEDYEEPVKPYWFVNDLDGKPMKCDLKNCYKFNFIKWRKRRKQIGNYFKTKEEVEKAVEKLKAWKRLKDADFIINSWNGNLGGGDHYDCCGQVNITAKVGDRDKRNTVKEDLDLLFGGEE